MGKASQLLFAVFLSLSGLAFVDFANAQESKPPQDSKPDSDLDNPIQPDALIFAPQSKEAGRKLSHKVFARMSSGIVSNVGTLTGSGFTFGGINLGVALFFMEQFAVGAGYKIETDFSSIPLQGFDLFGRYYFLGPGTVVQSRDNLGNNFEKQRTFNPYIGAEFSKRDYYVLGDPKATDPAERAYTGTLSAINATLGIDYRISSHWEANAEFNMTMLPFAGSDPRIVIRWMLVSMGASYAF